MFHRKTYTMVITPKHIFYKGMLFKITNIPEFLKIHGFTVIINDEQIIQNVIIKDHHPNAIDKNDVRKIYEKASENTLLCLSGAIKDKPLAPDIIEKIISCLETYNYDSAYWTDWYYVKYERKNVQEAKPNNEFKISENKKYFNPTEDTNVFGVLNCVGISIYKLIRGVIKNVTSK